VNKALLDTDILSEIGKGIDPNVARNATAYRTAFGRYTLSVITIMEVARGFQKKQSLGRLQRFLTAIGSEEILPFDQPAAELAGRIAGDLDRLGQPIGRADPMIAAIALGHGMELVTGNTAHYQRIQQLGYPLTLVSWR
jgi:tRNA(fMet)-specific endonuclease VapC